MTTSDGVAGQPPPGSAASISDAIAIRDLSARRGGRRVLSGVSAAVSRGRITGLLGPSGAGKTTLMRAIVGVQRIEAGTLRVLDAPAGSAALRRRIGYVTQSPAVYPDLTVEQNLAYFGAIVGAPEGAVAGVLSAVGLESRRRALAGRLSGGERARVSLGAALIGEPELLVLDEPTVGLDPVLRRDLWALFRELARSGVTLLVSSHVMDEADECDHIILMREGGVIASGAREALLARTGAANVREAFLAIVERTGAAP